MFEQCETDPLLALFVFCFLTPFIFLMWGALFWVVYQIINDFKSKLEDRFRRKISEED
jgi:hypothetical protein